MRLISPSQCISSSEKRSDQNITTIMENLKCQICPAFYTLTIATMLSHLIRVHGFDPVFFVKCDVPGCQHTFRKPRSYQSHLRRQHRDFNLHSNVRTWGEIDEERHEEERIPLADFAVDEPVDAEELYDKIEDRLGEKKKMDALFLLQTKEVNKLTQKATKNIMDNVTSIVKNTVEILRMGVQNRLDSAGLRFDAVPGLTELFEDDHSICNPFSHVNTEHKQAAYFRENFGLVVS